MSQGQMLSPEAGLLYKASCKSNILPRPLYTSVSPVEHLGIGLARPRNNTVMLNTII
jgi:hypothetical protein